MRAAATVMTSRSRLSRAAPGAQLGLLRNVEALGYSELLLGSRFQTAACFGLSRGISLQARSWGSEPRGRRLQIQGPNESLVLMNSRHFQLNQRAYFASSTGSGDENKEKKPQEETQTQNQGQSQGEKAAQSAKKIAETIKDFSKKATESVKQMAQRGFSGKLASGETWDEAFREVFGMNRNRRKQQKEQAEKEKEEAEKAEAEAKAAGEAEAGKEQENVLWYEATDPSTQKVYYYNDKGETKWKDELTEGEALEIKKRTPSFLEEKLKTLGAQIGDLEKERDEAMKKSNMSEFKKMNAQIRAIRKEMENIGARLNSTALVSVGSSAEEEAKRKSLLEKLAETVKESKIGEGLKKIQESEGVKKAREAAEDMREVWETSQNPWVYRAHSAYDTVFSENEQGEALKEIRKTDPKFTIEDFLIECEEEILPPYINAFLSEDKTYLRKMSGDTAFAFANAHIDQRIRDKKKKYPNILGVDNVQLYNFRIVDKVGPVVVVVVIAHQVDVEYDYDGKILKGDENKIEAVPYVFALTREYNEETAEYGWRVMEFSPSAGVAMLV